MSEVPTITWVNHASYILGYKGTQLLVDPWLVGTAFADGWAHTTPTAIPNFDEITHIWISHEHPDHFSPASLKLIPEGRRGEITFIYQPSKDHRVANFCSKLGFKVVESSDRITLGPDFDVQLMKWHGGDAILGAWVGSHTVLNFNDAIIPNPSAARWALQSLAMSNVDVLLTQFSYANRVGNPDQPHIRRTAAREKLDRMQMQIRAVQPDYVIPFASHVWFCHEENFYLNDGIATPLDAVEAVEGLAKAVMLYPGDSWGIGSEIDARRAAEKYATDVDARLAEGPLHRTPAAVPLDELQALGDAYNEALNKDNNALVIAALRKANIMKDVRIYLSDLDIEVSLTPDGLREVQRSAQADVSLTSPVLAFILKNPFGGATTQVNGRYSIPSGEQTMPFRFYWSLRDLNARSEGFANASYWKARSIAWSLQERLSKSTSSS